MPKIQIIKPAVIVSLGATAAQALLGRKFRVTRQRGELLPLGENLQVLATLHPSAILRAPDGEARHHEMQLFIKDLQVVAQFIAV